VLAGSGMRIATWQVEGQECTLMSFPGDVGGDEANIRRWLGQIGQTVPAETLAAFVASPARFTTVRWHRGTPVRLRRSTRCVTGSSVLASDHSRSETSPSFVKLMGDAAVLKRQKAAFETLSRSIALKPEAR
jgi:hypothetical protein